MSIDRAPDTFVAPGARLSGDVRMASESSIWFGTVVSGDLGPVELHSRANVQDNCVVEGRPDQPAIIGAGVSLGHNARVIGAIIQRDSLIAISATVLPGSVVGSHSIIAANATVPENTVIPPRSLVIGLGRVLRTVTEVEIARIELGATDYARLCREYRGALQVQRSGD